jgi:hypothetical protein
LVVLLLAGCGSRKSEQPTATEWAAGVCGAIDTWATSLKSSATSLTKGDVSKESIDNAANQMQSATNTLQSELKALGRPNTREGQQATNSLDQLVSGLEADMQTLQSTLSSVSSIRGAMDGANGVSPILATMRYRASTLYSQLKQGSASRALRTALVHSVSCSKLSSQLSA